MALAMARFVLSHLYSNSRTVRKACNPGAGTPVLSQRNCGRQSKSGQKCTSMSGLAHRGDFTHLPYHSSRLVANQMCLARKRAAMAPAWRVAATRVFALPQAKRVAYTDWHTKKKRRFCKSRDVSRIEATKRRYPKVCTTRGPRVRIFSS